MDFPIIEISIEDYPENLRQIPKAPQAVYVRGTLPSQDMKCLVVVGARHYTDYARHVVEYLVGGLRDYPISIISGLAIGIDTLAHTTALEVGLHTISVPGSGIEDSVIYPSRNKTLARRILESGGALLSEFEPDFRATRWSFPQRNRIMAGLADAVLLIEAGEKSGTLITARLAVDFNRELFVVPGNIFSDNSKGVHQFLKLGATPVTEPQDIIDVLGLTPTETRSLFQPSLSLEEEAVLAILSEPRDNDEVLRLLPLPPQESLTLLMRMELSGLIKESNGVFYKV